MTDRQSYIERLEREVAELRGQKGGVPQPQLVTCRRCSGTGTEPISLDLAQALSVVKEEPETVGNLAELCGIKYSAMAYRLDLLLEMGLVRKAKERRGFRWSLAPHEPVVRGEG